MLKKRIIGVILVKNDIVVQSLGFRRYLPLGRPEIAAEHLSQWGIDEIVLLDISATHSRSFPNLNMVERVARHCMVPLAVGGGITNIEIVKHLFQCGADKIVVNQACLYNPILLSQIASEYGSQSILASIDILNTGNGLKVFDYLRQMPTIFSPLELATKVIDHGAGEIFLNSVDRDGSYAGYDLSVIQNICSNINRPVICCGGAGVPEHFVEVFCKTKVHGAAASNMFHFTEHSVALVKASLNTFFAIRVMKEFNYLESKFDSFGRLEKKDEDILEQTPLDFTE